MSSPVYGEALPDLGVAQMVRIFSASCNVQLRAWMVCHVVLISNGPSRISSANVMVKAFVSVIRPRGSSLRWGMVGIQCCRFLERMK